MTGHFIRRSLYLPLILDVLVTRIENSVKPHVIECITRFGSKSVGHGLHREMGDSKSLFRGLKGLGIFPETANPGIRRQKSCAVL